MAYPVTLPKNLLFGKEIQKACDEQGFPARWAYAIKINETGLYDVGDHGLFTSPSVTSQDGGRGIFQLTSSYPEKWDDPYTNCKYALHTFLMPNLVYIEQNWGVQDLDLLRCVAAAFNAGLGGAEKGHQQGDVDKYTTNRYGERAVQNLKTLDKIAKVRGVMEGDS